MYEIKTDWIPREEQEIMLEKFESFLETDNKFFFIDAPVGTGKSFGAVLMAKMYEEKNKGEFKYDVITNTKQLQEQYLRDFAFMRSIKGIENYRCFTHGCSCAEGMTINKMKNTSCNQCSYSMAKAEYMNCKVSVTNFHMFINYFQYVPDVLMNRNSKILFIDEAHLFEETFCSFIEAEIGKKILEEHEIWDQEWMEDLNQIRTFADAANFIRDKIISEIKIQISELSLAASRCNTEESIKIIRKVSQLERIRQKYNRFLEKEDDWKTNWIIEFERDENKNRNIKLQAIWGTKYLREIWQMYDRIVFMSGTLLDRIFFMKLMGCDMSESEFLTIDSPFPVENRLIHYKPVGKMSFNEKHKTFKKMIPAIEEILEEHKDVKGVIHTANYELSSWVQTGVKDKRLMFHDSKTREFTIRLFSESNENSVIVSPSLTNGVDFKDDLSRLQILLKVPYPNLTSEQVKRRMRSNDKWYAWKTLCDVIQCYGRSIRSKTDWAVTYILDENFQTLLNRVSVPRYIKKAIRGL